MDKFKIIAAKNGIWIGLIALIAYFAFANPRFFSVTNAHAISVQIAELGLIAIALSFLVMAGTLDLSVGSVVSLSAVISATVIAQTQSIVSGLLVGLVVGGLAGAINGFLIAYLKLNPLVITLGFLSAWGGLALFFTQGATVVGFPDDFRALSKVSFFGIPFQVILLIVVALLAWWILEKTPFGRNVLAIGGNKHSSFLMGIKVWQTQFVLFVMTGVFGGLAGFLLTVKLQAAPPTVGSTMEIQALTIVLLGGIALEGGMGRISGVIAGLLFVGVLRNGLVILGVSQFLQTVLIGLTLVVAVVLDGSIQKVIKKSWAGRGVQTPKTTKLEAAK